MFVWDAGIERLTRSAIPHIGAKRPRASLRTASLHLFKKCSVMALVLLTLALAFALALLLAAALCRLAAAERGTACAAQPRLVLEQAGRDLAAVRNEFAAD